MNRTLKHQAVALGVSLLVFGCGPKVGEDEEPVERVEHRVGPCRAMCEIRLHPECGHTTHPNFPMFESVDACVDSCARTNSVDHWGPQPDGTDACETEWDTYVACMQGLSCEDQHQHFAASPTSEYPCKAEADELARCGQANPVPEEGGS